MKIIEYDPKYEEDEKDLLVELEEYIVSIDKDELDQVGERYREEYLGILLDNMAMKQGKVYLAIESDKAIGLVAGSIKEWEYADHLDYKCPKTGIVEELIVTRRVRALGIGKELLKRIEQYFTEKGCEYADIDVFAYNNNAINFYDRNDYHARMHTLIKKL